MTTFKISQSIYKKFLRYEDKKLCGLLLEAEIKGEVKYNSSKAQGKGSYFEYLATGALPAYGDPVPEPDKYQKDQVGDDTWKKKGGDPENKPGYKKGDVKAEWLHPKAQADAFKRYCKELGIKILSTGKRVENDGIRGTLDLELFIPQKSWLKVMGDKIEYKDVVTTDLKFSDLIGRRNDKRGWHPETFQDSFHTFQAKTYTIITGNPFLYWVFSSSTMDSRFFPVKCDEYALERFKSDLLAAKARIEVEMQTGFFAYPDLLKCSTCQLRDKCEKKATLPKTATCFAGF